MKLLILCLAAAGLAGCGRAPAGADASVEELMQTSREWSKAAQAGDLDKVASYFADDAVIISAGEQPVRGRAAIRAYLAEASQIPGFRIRWEPLEGKVSGDMGYLLERTQITMDGPQRTPVVQTLQAVTVWRRMPDGSWKNVVDASVPAAERTPGS